MVYNIWHDIDPARVSTDEFVAVIEIEKGSKTKYELDKETGFICLDRILYTSMQYPTNYGFIPRTYAEDHDPLDALVLCSETIKSGTLVNCYPIGVLHLVDGGELDDKIIAVPCSDPHYNKYKDISELPQHIFDEMCHFFSVYKDLEHKKTEVTGVEGVEVAKQIIDKCIKLYKDTFVK